MRPLIFPFTHSFTSPYFHDAVVSFRAIEYCWCPSRDLSSNLAMFIYFFSLRGADEPLFLTADTQPRAVLDTTHLVPLRLLHPSPTRPSPQASSPLLRIPRPLPLPIFPYIQCLQIRGHGYPQCMPSFFKLLCSLLG